VAINTFVERRTGMEDASAVLRVVTFLSPRGKDAQPHFYHCAVYHQEPATRSFLDVLRGIGESWGNSRMGFTAGSRECEIY